MKYIQLDTGRQYVCGIYVIESVCGKTYVGSAVSLKTRFMTHRRALINGKHDNSRLQNHFNKYGFDSLQFRVIELCSQDALIEREQFFIDSLNPFFNIALIAGATYGLKPWLNRKHSEETKAKIKATNLATFAKRPQKPKRIKLTRAENNLRLSEINKTEAGRERCSLLHKGNTYWLGKKHSAETIQNRMGNLNPNSKSIHCVELNKTFSTGVEAYTFFKVSPAAITNAIKRGTKIASKYSLTYG